MSTIVTRLGKGSALTWEEADANFTNLNTDKVDTSTIKNFVIDFGAVKTVGTSNTAAFDAALSSMASSGARVLYIPEGYYDFDTKPAAITLSGLRIIADPNAYFYRNYVPGAATDGFFDIKCSLVHIENLTIIAKLGTTGVAIKAVYPDDGSYTADYGVLKNVRVYGDALHYWSKDLYLDGTLRIGGTPGIRDWLIDNCRFWDVESGGKHIHFEEAIATSVIGGGFFKGSGPGTGLAHISGSSGHPSQTVCFVNGAWSGTIQVEWTTVGWISGSLATALTIDANSTNVTCVAGGGYSVTNDSTTCQKLNGGYQLTGKSSIALAINHNAGGSSTASGIKGNTTVLSDVTSSYAANQTGVNVQSSIGFVLPQLYHYSALQGTFNSPSTVINQYGFITTSTMTGADNNFGFYGALTAASGRHNFYAVGDADNYFAGTIASLGSYTATTAVSANMAIASNGAITRATSSRRYKKDVEPLDDARADAIVFGAKPVWYRSTCKGDNQAWGYYGLIAEDEADVDPRLVHWGRPARPLAIKIEHAAEKDPAGNEIKAAWTETINTFEEDTDAPLRAEGVMYDRYVAPMLNVIQRQQKAIEALQARIDKL